MLIIVIILLFIIAVAVAPEIVGGLLALVWYAFCAVAIVAIVLGIAAAVAT